MAVATSSAEIMDLKFEALMNGKYHADREAHLDRFDKWVTFFILFAGGATFSQVANDNFGYIFPAAVSIFALVQLVFTPSVRARKHAFQRENYFKLCAKLELKKSSLAEIKAEMLELAGQEEPIFHAVHNAAHNWACLALHGDEAVNSGKVLLINIKIHQRLLRNYLRFENTNFI